MWWKHPDTGRRSAMRSATSLAAAVAGSLLLGASAIPGHQRDPGRAAATPADTLISPPVLQNISKVPGTVEVVLTAAPARIALLPGHVTDAEAYNGSVPARRWTCTKATG